MKMLNRLPDKKTKIPKPFLEAFRDDKPVVYVVGEPQKTNGCPYKIEINADGSYTYYYGCA